MFNANLIGIPNYLFLLLRTFEMLTISIFFSLLADARLTWLTQQARIDCDCLYPVITPKASEFIVKFDEHSIMDKFKFGVLYQKFGQLTEESIFGNRTHSPAMEEFLEMLGRKVELSTHEGYRGGLDTRHGQTGKMNSNLCYRVMHDDLDKK